MSEITTCNVEQMYLTVLASERSAFITNICDNADIAVIKALQQKISFLLELTTINKEAAMIAADALSFRTSATRLAYIKRHNWQLTEAVKGFDAKCREHEATARSEKQKQQLMRESALQTKIVELTGKKCPHGLAKYADGYAKSLCAMYAAAVEKKRSPEKALRLILQYGIALRDHESVLTPTPKETQL